MSDGSLLHLYRDCSLGEGDLDLVIELSWWNTTNGDRLEQALLSGGFGGKTTFGQFGSVGYQEAWGKNDIKVNSKNLISISTMSEG